MKIKLDIDKLVWYHGASSLTIWLVGVGKKVLIMSDKTPIEFKPFPIWKGARVAINSSIASEMFRAVFMMPVPSNDKDRKTLYNQNKVQWDVRGTRSVHYTADGNGKDDGKVKAFINKAMKDGKCDLDEIQEKGIIPPDALWFIKRKETTKTKVSSIKVLLSVSYFLISVELPVDPIKKPRPNTKATIFHIRTGKVLPFFKDLLFLIK